MTPMNEVERIEQMYITKIRENEERWRKLVNNIQVRERNTSAAYRGGLSIMHPVLRIDNDGDRIIVTI
jgi:hypothetical protein